MTDARKKKWQHSITVLLIIASLCFSVFYFGFPIVQRLWMSVCDVGRSLGAYGILLATGGDGAIVPTVQNIPDGIDTVLPLSFEELRELVAEIWSRLWNWKNFLSFLLWLTSKIALLMQWLALLAIPALLIWLVGWLVYRDVDNDYNVDSRPLKWFKRFEQEKLWKIKGVVKEFFAFIKKRWYYWLALALIWAYNLNLITIALETVAYFFYICWQGIIKGLSNLPLQLAKLVLDLSVMHRFLPRLLRWYLYYRIFNWWRWRRGRKNVEKCIKKDNEFIDRHPGTLFINGKQRAKKSSMLAMLKRLYERRWRERAEKKMRKWERRYPFFPWINLRRFLDKSRRQHKIYMLYHCRQFAKALRRAYTYPEGTELERRLKEMLVRSLKFRYGYEGKDLLFDYNVEYGTTYNNGAVEVDVFDMIETYAQLYFIYSTPDPLDFSSLAIREDFKFKDKGNFRKFDGDLLGRTVEESMKLSKYSHVIEYDALRPGMKFDPDNPKKDGVEFGIICMPEAGKERKNKNTRAAGGNKAAGEAGIATQDNDGFEIDVKVRGQVSLVDYDDYCVYLLDDQRAGDLGATNGELTTKALIKGAAEEHLVIPFYAIEYSLIKWLLKVYDKFNDWITFRKGSNTLLHHLLKKLSSRLEHSLDSVEQRFTVWKLNLRMMDGADGELLDDEVFYLPNFVVYRHIFASDVCKTFYEYRHKKSAVGIDDYECYDSVEVNIEKMQAQHSYFTEDMVVYNGIDSARKRAKQNGKRGRGNTNKRS